MCRSQYKEFECNNIITKFEFLRINLDTTRIHTVGGVVQLVGAAQGWMAWAGVTGRVAQVEADGRRDTPVVRPW